MTLHTRTAGQLRDALDRGETTSVEIVRALQARADAVDERVGGWAFQMRAEALKDAERADAERARGEAHGPLHGLPVSIKENIDVAGTASTLGMRARAGKLAERDAVVVRLLREAGAIVLGKSNVPQTMLAPMECTNRLFGTTRNPWSLAHGPGGSSGGEGALLASGQSVLGVGSDLGGSVRFPAAYCGVAALKPTNHRWSNVGVNTAIMGQETIRAQVGPLARNAADLALVFRALATPLHVPLDPNVPPLPVGDPGAVDVSGLKIGWYDDDGFVTPSASCRRAVREAVEALRAAGAELIETPPSNQREILQLYVGATSSDGMRTLARGLAGEPVVDPLSTMWRMGHLPEAVRRTAMRALPLLGEKRLAAIVEIIGPKPVERLWELTAERQRMQVAEHDAWRASDIDAMVCPATTTPAVPIGMSKDFTAVFVIAGRYNLLNFPAGVVPATRVRAEEARPRAVHDRLDKRAAAVEERSEGLPVGVQVVGLPWREDVVLAVMAAVEAAARAREGFPETPVEPRGEG